MSTGNTTPPPVFPQTDATHIGDGRGLTLRDYVAVQALGGWLASFGANAHYPDPAVMYVIADKAYLMADAMLTARAKGGR